MSDLSTLTLDAALSEVGEWVAAHQFEQAIQRCNELLAAYPAAVRVIRARAQALDLSGEARPAIDDYRRVLEIFPADDSALLGLAHCLAADSQSREAATIARQALDYTPQNAEALTLAADEMNGKVPEGTITRSLALLRGGIAGRAITLMRRMNEAEPDRTDVQALLAEMLWRNGVRITCAELCQAILDEQPDCLNAHVILSAIWSQAGNSDLAALHRRAVESLDPDYRQTNEWLGDASPLQPRDVLALPSAPQQPAAETSVAQDQAMEKEEVGDPDRSAWVDDLIASSGPVTAIPQEEPPASVPAAGAAAVSDVYAGEVTDTAPLEWTPAETDSGNVTISELPQWLRDLQASAARRPAVEAEESPVDATPIVEAVPEQPLAEGDVVAIQTDWTPVPAEAPPIEAPISEPLAVEAVAADAPAESPVEQTPVESNPAPSATEEPAPIQPASLARKHGRKRKSSKAGPTNDEILTQARKAVEAGRYDEAAGYYNNLISAGKKLNLVMADLDAATHAYPEVRRFHALLGDVYTRKGDVNAALMAYHRALESQSK